MASGSIWHTRPSGLQVRVPVPAPSVPVPPPIYVPPTELTGLVSYWKFNEMGGNAADSVNGNTLTSSGGLVYGTGKIANAAVFDGIDSSLGIAADVANLSFTDDFTICCWVWIDSAAELLLGHVIIGKLTSYFLLEYWLVWERYGLDCVRFYVAEVEGVDPVMIDSQNGLPVETWHFVRAWVGSGAAHIQINNGTIYNSGAVTPHDGIHQFHVGSVMGTHDFINGRIDELGIWNRALTDAEALRLYNGGVGLSYPF
jgi:Concanavalin A-like lectin/glucanases superfamily